MAKYVTGTCSSTPISNISYVGLDEFKKQVDSLKSTYDCDVIYIYHKGEFGKKDHIHYLIKSNGCKLNNVPNIMRIMYNYDTDGNKTKSLLFSQCKSLGDYYLYSLHNKEYLDKKGETKEFYDYDPSCLLGDSDLINACYLDSVEINKDSSTLSYILELAQSGASDLEILKHYKNDLSINDIGYAIKSIQSVKNLIANDCYYATFFNECYRFAIDHLKKGDVISLNMVEFFEKEIKVSDMEKGIKLFQLFLDKLTVRDLMSLFSNT